MSSKRCLLLEFHLRDHCYGCKKYLSKSGRLKSVDSVILTALRACPGNSWRIGQFRNKRRIGQFRNKKNGRIQKEHFFPCVFIDKMWNALGKFAEIGQAHYVITALVVIGGELGSFGKLLIWFDLCSSRKEKYWQVKEGLKESWTVWGYNNFV